jgi:hypothetical protein
VTCTGCEVTVLATASDAVAVRVEEPSVSGVEGMHDQAPLSDAVVLQIVLPPTVTVTVASGSLVPDTVGVVVTVAPADGEVIATAGGKSVTLATPSPLIVTTTLCTVTCPLPFRSRKSAAECSWPPKNAPVAVTVAVFHVLVLVSGMLGVAAPYGSDVPLSYWTWNEPVPES